jgi:hypothetical protein
MGDFNLPASHIYTAGEELRVSVITAARALTMHPSYGSGGFPMPL